MMSLHFMSPILSTSRESIRVLQECIELQTRKGVDYQNAVSRIKQADYYPNGILTLMDIVHAKKLRLESVVSAMLNDPNYQPNFESIEDSAKDMANYCSFIVSYCRGKMDGQKANHDIFNRPKKEVKG